MLKLVEPRTQLCDLTVSGIESRVNLLCPLVHAGAPAGPGLPRPGVPVQTGGLVVEAGDYSREALPGFPLQGHQFLF